MAFMLRVFFSSIGTHESSLAGAGPPFDWFTVLAAFGSGCSLRVALGFAAAGSFPCRYPV